MMHQQAFYDMTEPLNIRPADPLQQETQSPPSAVLGSSHFHQSGTNLNHPTFSHCTPPLERTCGRLNPPPHSDTDELEYHKQLPLNFDKMFEILCHHLLTAPPGRNGGRELSTRFLHDPSRGYVAAGALILAGSITLNVSLIYLLKRKEAEESPPPIPGFRG